MSGRRVPKSIIHRRRRLKEIVRARPETLPRLNKAGNSAPQVGNKTVYFNMKQCYFVEIKSGEKKIEFRARSARWIPTHAYFRVGVWSASSFLLCSASSPEAL